MIQRKIQICKGCDRERPIYAKGLCAYCYSTAKKNEKKPCKGCGIPSKIYAKGLCMPCYMAGVKESMLKHKQISRVRKVTGEAVLFEDIWDKRVPHVSAVSNKPISQYEYLTRKCFAHVLPKKGFPRFRLLPENIEYLTWSEHTFWDNRTEEELQYRISIGEDWGYMLRREAELKIQYKSGSSI